MTVLRSSPTHCIGVCKRSTWQPLACDPLNCGAVLWPLLQISTLFWNWARKELRISMKKNSESWLRASGMWSCIVKYWFPMFQRLSSPRKILHRMTQCHVPKIRRSSTTPLWEPKMSRFKICAIGDSHSSDYEGRCRDVTPCKLV